MTASLPPLNALRAFEAAARLSSFSKAAEELHVTPAALSHQIKGLEDVLGIRLFHRRTRQVELTDAGRRLYPGLHTAFQTMRQAVASLDRMKDDRVLVISAPPGIVAKWLAPRLYRFMMRMPDIDARISSSVTMVDFVNDGVDVAIRNIRIGSDTDPDLVVEPLIELDVAPVCSPRLLAEMPPLTGLDDIRRFNLIHDDSLNGRPLIPTWADWLKAASIDGIDVSRGLRFSSADHALDACVEGAGMLLAYSLLAHDDLRTGRLAMPFPLALRTGRAFHFVCLKGTEKRPKIAAFRDWIREEIARLEPGLALPAGSTGRPLHHISPNGGDPATSASPADHAR